MSKSGFCFRKRINLTKTNLMTCSYFWGGIVEKTHKNSRNKKALKIPLVYDSCFVFTFVIYDDDDFCHYQGFKWWKYSLISP